jgi:hypothetical protein
MSQQLLCSKVTEILIFQMVLLFQNFYLRDLLIRSMPRLLYSLIYYYFSFFFYLRDFLIRYPCLIFIYLYLFLFIFNFIYIFYLRDLLIRYPCL